MKGRNANPWLKAIRHKAGREGLSRSRHNGRLFDCAPAPARRVATRTRRARGQSGHRRLERASIRGCGRGAPFLLDSTDDRLARFCRRVPPFSHGNCSHLHTPRFTPFRESPFVTRKAALEDRGRGFFARGSKLSYSRGRRWFLGRVPCWQRQARRFANGAASCRAATPCEVYLSGVLRLPPGVSVECFSLSFLCRFFSVALGAKEQWFLHIPAHQAPSWHVSGPGSAWPVR